MEQEGSSHQSRRLSVLLMGSNVRACGLSLSRPLRLAGRNPTAATLIPNNREEARRAKGNPKDLERKN